jgi:hypothetical protein
MVPGMAKALVLASAMVDSQSVAMEPMTPMVKLLVCGHMVVLLGSGAWIESGVRRVPITYRRKLRQHAAPLSIYFTVDVGYVFISLNWLTTEGASVLAAAGHPGNVSGYTCMSCHFGHCGVAQNARTDDTEDSRAGNWTGLRRYQDPVVRDATCNFFYVIGDHCPVKGILEFKQK